MIFNDLALFAAVAKHLSFSAAAHQTGLPLSRVSRRIAVLEAHLGAKLFERTTRQVRLTEEGRRLLDRCQAPMEALQDIVGFSSDTRQQTIRITAPPLAARMRIGPKLLDFAARYPHISIELTATNAFLDFFRDNIDLAFRLGPLDDSSLTARRLWPVPYCFCAGRKFAIENELTEPISASELKRVRAVMSKQPWLLSDGTQIRPAVIAHQFDELGLLLDAVQRNLGVAMLPREMLSGDLQVLSIAGTEAMTRVMYAVYPSKRLLPFRIRSLIDYMAADEIK